MEKRLCFLKPNASPERKNPNTETPEREFEKARARDLADKYAISSDERVRERVEQYNRIEEELMRRFREEPAAHAELIQEMTQVSEELHDALTRATYNRVLLRRNRFDTDEEHRVVQRESADYHQHLRQQEQNRKAQRGNQERQLKNAEEQWQDVFHLEVPYRLIMSGGQGADDTIDRAVDALAAHIPLVKQVKEDDIDNLLKEIDRQLAENSNLGADTRKKLRKLKEMFR